MMKSAEERFVSEITKGFWIAPRRRREIRREIYDHLDNILYSPSNGTTSRGDLVWEIQKSSN